MVDRLNSLDVSFLYMETATTAMHVGGVAVFEPPADGFDYDRLVELISRRIALVPRYRQKVRQVPGRLANPVWVDDEEFDVTYHVRRSALPRPGSDAQLRELVARLQSRQLDRNRPLWEIYLVEGLEGGRVAVVTKTHHAMVDGVAAVDIGTVILDVSATPRDTPADDWVPRRAPGTVSLVAGAVGDLVQRPTVAVDAVRTAVVDVRTTVGAATSMATGLLQGLRTIARPAPGSPLNVRIGEQRRFGMARTSLEDYKAVRRAHGGTVNDVVLATVSGALRTWLLTRGEPVVPTSSVRAMVPVSIRSDAEKGELGNRVSSYFVDLPVGEGNPVVRLAQVSHAMRGHKESGQSVGADALVQLSGFAPPTIHALGARAASTVTRRLFNLVVTNVPGPQFPLYAAGARMLEMYPVVPLGEGPGGEHRADQLRRRRLLRPQRRPRRHARHRRAGAVPGGVAGRAGGHDVTMDHARRRPGLVSGRRRGARGRVVDRRPRGAAGHAAGTPARRRLLIGTSAGSVLAAALGVRHLRREPARGADRRKPRRPTVACPTTTTAARRCRRCPRPGIGSPARRCCGPPWLPGRSPRWPPCRRCSRRGAAAWSRSVSSSTASARTAAGRRTPRPGPSPWTTTPDDGWPSAPTAPRPPRCGMRSWPRVPSPAGTPRCPSAVAATSTAAPARRRRWTSC